MRKISENKNLDTVSVIIPTFNRESTIEKSIYSVLNQTYQNIELIVVDDNSSDDTESIVKNIQDDRIIYIKNVNNYGVATSRNIGIERATGDFIAFNDSDDTWKLDKIEKQMRVMKSNSDCMLVYCAFNKIYLDGHRERVPNNEMSLENLQGNIFMSLLKRNFVSTQTMLFRRKCLEQEGLFKTGLRALDDYELVLRVAEKHKILFVNECLVDVLESENSISVIKNNYKAHFEAHLYILEKYWNKIEDKCIFASTFGGLCDFLNYMSISELDIYVRKIVSFFWSNKLIGDYLVVLLKNQRRYQYKDTIMKKLMEIHNGKWKLLRDKKNIFRIAVYGNGYIGYTIRMKAHDAGIHVVYTIDKDPAKADYTMESLAEVDELERVDMIIISIFDETNKIKNELEQIIQVPIVHIDEFIEELVK